MAHQEDLSITVTKAVQSALASSQAPMTDKKIQCGYLWKKVKKLPNLTKKKINEIQYDDFRSKKVVDIMRLVRFPGKDTIGSGATYKSVKRHIEKLDKGIPQRPLPIIRIEQESADSRSLSELILSPVSALPSPSLSSGSVLFTEISEE